MYGKKLLENWGEWPVTPEIIATIRDHVAYHRLGGMLQDRHGCDRATEVMIKAYDQAIERIRKAEARCDRLRDFLSRCFAVTLTDEDGNLYDDVTAVDKLLTELDE